MKIPFKALSNLGFVTKSRHAKVVAENAELHKIIGDLVKRNNELVSLCGEKDEFFKELASDALRHGSSLAGKHMSDLNSYLKGR